MLNKSISNFILNLIFIIKFLSLISYTISTLSFSYPTSITLGNGNIFIIHKFGICICDPSFSTIIKDNVYTFQSEEQISDLNKLSQVSIREFSDGVIISVIINRIYFFDPQGNYKIRSTTFSSGISYYSLTPHKTEYSVYYYLVAYIYGTQLNLEYYRYDPSETEKIKKLSQKK